MATALDNLARKQIYIPATQPETVQLRVAAYCRVSTDSDDQLNSFAAQNTHYNQMIRNHDLWELVDIYADAGITGTSAAKRGDFQRMLADCRKGKIDKILVKTISRFARNSMECLETIRELKALGISVFFEEHNIDTKMVSSEMLTAVIAACAQAESESISKNTRWGIQKKMEQGEYVASSVPFGFKRIDGKLEIDNEEAPYVIYLFREYLSGKSTGELSKEYLYKSANDEILKRRQWHVQSIVEMLKNEKYMGDCLNQKTYVTEELPRRTCRNRGAREQYYVTNAHPAIVDRDTFMATQKLLRKRAENHIAHSSKTTPLGAMVVCGHCGANFRRKCTGRQYVYACRTRLENVQACNVQQIREEAFKEAFCRMYFNLKNHPEVLDSLLKNMTSVRNRQMLWSPVIMELNKEISDILSQSHALSLLKKQGAVDSDVFISMSNQLAEQLRSAKQRKEQLQKMDDDETITQTQNLIETLDAGPEFLETFDEELFCELIDKIIVDSNTKIRFRLKNGLELPESIERTIR